MVYDCIPFFNELDILKLRLHILNPYVDRFVIEEAAVTFSGEAKELVFEQNKKLFQEFLHKIDYIVVDDSPVEATTHERDKFQKNKLIQGLQDIAEDDIIILSDVDEIPNPEELEKIIARFEPDKIYHMAQRMFYCFMNMEEVSGKLLSVTGEFEGVARKKWLGTKIFGKNNIPAGGIIDIREADPASPESIRVDNGGWHFGYMGGRGEKDVSKRIGVKVLAAAHQEYSDQDTLAEAADKLILGQDIFGRDAEFVRVEIDDSYPAYLREHQKDYEYLIMPPIGKGQAEYTKVTMKAKRFCRKAVRKAGRIYNKAAVWLSMGKIAAAAAAGLIISLLPVLYLEFINRASGDDYGFGVYTRNAWVNTHSLIEVLRASGRMVKQVYAGWQGTWFSIFLFTLQPEVFSEKAYFIVTFLALLLWIGVTSFVLHYFLVGTAGFSRSTYITIDALFLLINMQFIPGIKSSLFWYNGIIHYLLPYTMCLLVIWCLAEYVRSHRWRHFGILLILLTLLGGSNYQAALFGGIITVFFLGTAYLRNRKGGDLLLLIPLLCEAVGLLISMKAPGNKVRGGEDFGFSFWKIFGTIISSFVEATKQIGYDIKEKPIVFIGLLLLLILIGRGWLQSAVKKKYPFPGLFVLAAFCLYSAMQAPELYAATDVSLGVANMNYQIFLLMILADGVYVLGWVKGSQRPDSKILTVNSYHAQIVIPAIILCLPVIVLLRSDIKKTTAWQCADYIISGQAADYKEQMDLQTAIMLDAGIEDAAVPFINDDQGPFMHMPATGDPGAWTNTVMKDFYNKKSVIAMDRLEWEREYGLYQE